jgi:PKD repeat protein
MSVFKNGLLLSLFVLTASVMIVPKLSMAVDIAMVYVHPTPIEAEPGEEFSVDVRIRYAIDVFAWEVKLVWNASVLNYINATEGGFLKGAEVKPTYWVNPVVNQNESAEYNSVLMACTRQGAGITGAAGSGTLTTIWFEVQNKGETTLDLQGQGSEETKLRDSVPNPVPHNDVNGLFSNVAGFPRADFSFTPAKANIGETITFDASASYDVEDGSIVAYTWDFGDTSTFSAAGPLAYHNYTEGGTYDATLTVTDNDSWNKSVTKSVKVRFPYDVMIVEVKESVQSAVIGDVVTVTVKLSNEGANDLTGVSVTAYYETTQIGSAQTTSLAVDQNKTLTFDWNTQDLSAGNYRVKGVVSPVEGEPADAQLDNTKLGGTVALSEPVQTNWALYGGIIAAVAVVAVVGGFFFMRRRGNSGKKTPVS